LFCLDAQTKIDITLTKFLSDELFSHMKRLRMRAFEVQQFTPITLKRSLSIGPDWYENQGKH